MLLISEKRRFPRFSLPLPVSWRRRERDPGERLEHCRAEDVGLGGLRLRLYHPPDLKVGDHLALTIDTLRQEDPVKAEAVVRWLEVLPLVQEQRLGLQLTAMDKTDWQSWFELMPWTAPHPKMLLRTSGQPA